MNEKRAQIIAMLLSDGSVYFDKSKRTYCIQFTNSSEKMLKYFASIFCEEFGLRKYALNRCRNAKSVRFFSKRIALELFCYSPTYRTRAFADGTYPNCRIPQEIFDKKEFAAAFISAYASCDGCIYANKSHPRGVVEIACKHPALLSRLAQLLSIFLIRPRISKERVRIQDKESVRQFILHIGFLEESTISDTRSPRFGAMKNCFLSPCLPYSGKLPAKLST